MYWLLWLHISKASPVNYYKRPNDFVEMFASCVRDENCVFYFWKIEETRSDIINIQFRHVLETAAHANNCCMSRAVKQFEKDVEEYCLSKFSSYEVNGEQMREIVETCTKLRPGARTIVLFTYQNPYSYLISKINRICNVFLEKRSPVVQRVCRSCQYAEDNQAFFDRLIEQTNHLYLSTANITEMNLNNVQVLYLDIMDLDRFFETPSLRPEFDAIKIKWKYFKTETCNFGLKVEFIKNLSVSSEIYRKLIVGEY